MGEALIGGRRRRRGVPRRLHGRAVQVDPIKPTLKAAGTKRLKLKYYEPLSNFALKINLRRYITGACERAFKTEGGGSRGSAAGNMPGQAAAAGFPQGRSIPRTPPSQPAPGEDSRRAATSQSAATPSGAAESPAHLPPPRAGKNTTAAANASNANEVGQCRLPVSKPDLNARLLSALETKV